MSVPELDLRDYSRVVTYSKSSNERASEAVLSAFYAARIDIDDRDEVLFDQIENDGLDLLIEGSDQHLRVSTRLWDYTVVITPEDIIIYDSDGG
jgi:hypothetical protein